MNRIAAFLIATLLATTAAAQCAFIPADCPEATDYGSADDSTSRLLNPVLPLEISMENRLRAWAAGLIDRIATKEHWQYVELSEGSSSGTRAADGSVLAYPLRPPHWMMIHYQLIVNPDSLSAWLNWARTFGQRRLDATMAYANQQTSTTATPATIASASAAAEKADKDFEAERRRQTIHFRESSVLIVEFDFNMDYVKVIGAPSAATPAATLAGTSTVWFNNSDPVFNSIDLFDRCHSNAILFAGSFNRASDGQGYRPAWISDKASTNLSTPKKFKSDQLQSIDCHLSGNTPAIRQLLADIPPQELTGLLAKP